MKSWANNPHLLKFVSLFLAFTLWWYVLNLEPEVVERTFKLEVINPTGLASKLLLPQILSVKVKGSRSFTSKIQDGEKVFVDINHYPYKKNPKFIVKVKKSDFNLPFGLQVTNIEPSEFPIHLEKTIKKRVPLKALLVGKVSPDFKIVKGQVEPKEIMISGPRSILKKIGKLQTNPIDVTELEGDGQLKTSVSLKDTRVKIEQEEEEINLNFSVRPNTANITLRNIPISFLFTGRRILSRVRKVSIDVLVPDEKESMIKQDKIRVVGDIPHGSRGKVTVKLKAELPEGVHLLRIYPDIINLKVIP